MMVKLACYTDQMRQEQISRNQLSERLAEFGWVIAAPMPDLGEDFVVHIYFEGRATGVMFHVQEKSVTNLHERRKDDHLIYKNIAVKDLVHWEAFSLPVVLIVWHVTLREGRWALMNDIIADLDQRLTDWRDKQVVRVRLPWRNRTDDAGLVQLRQQVGQCLFPLTARHSSGSQMLFYPRRDCCTKPNGLVSSWLRSLMLRRSISLGSWRGGVFFLRKLILIWRSADFPPHATLMQWGLWSARVISPSIW